MIQPPHVSAKSSGELIKAAMDFMLLSLSDKCPELVACLVQLHPALPQPEVSAPAGPALPLPEVSTSSGSDPVLAGGSGESAKPSPAATRPSAQPPILSPAQPPGQLPVASPPPSGPAPSLPEVVVPSVPVTVGTSYPRVNRIVVLLVQCSGRHPAMFRVI